jgi:hypothetical protein
MEKLERARTVIRTIGVPILQLFTRANVGIVAQPAGLYSSGREWERGKTDIPTDFIPMMSINGEENLVIRRHGMQEVRSMLGRADNDIEDKPLGIYKDHCRIPLSAIAG